MMEDAFVDALYKTTAWLPRVWNLSRKTRRSGTLPMCSTARAVPRQAVGCGDERAATDETLQRGEIFFYRA